MTATEKDTNMLSAVAMLERWQGHRRLTRRVIEAFPEDKLFNFSVGSMRPFAELALEFLKMVEPTLKGIATGEWTSSNIQMPKTKAELLTMWDQATPEINRLWAGIPPHRFGEVDKAFGMWESRNVDTLFYVIENEIHHRGQGYVYLRALGIEPPHFWERD